MPNKVSSQMGEVHPPGGNAHENWYPVKKSNYRGGLFSLGKKPIPPVKNQRIKGPGRKGDRVSKNSDDYGKVNGGMDGCLAF